MSSTWGITSTSTLATPASTTTARQEISARLLGSSSTVATAMAPVPACPRRWATCSRSQRRRTLQRLRKAPCAPSRKVRPNALSGCLSPDQRGGSLRFFEACSRLSARCLTSSSVALFQARRDPESFSVAPLPIARGLFSTLEHRMHRRRFLATGRWQNTARATLAIVLKAALTAALTGGPIQAH